MAVGWWPAAQSPWLRQTHESPDRHEGPDRAVHAAYGPDYPLASDDVLSSLATLNLSRAAVGDAESGVRQASRRPALSGDWLLATGAARTAAVA